MCQISVQRIRVAQLYTDSCSEYRHWSNIFLFEVRLSLSRQNGTVLTRSVASMITCLNSVNRVSIKGLGIINVSDNG